MITLYRICLMYWISILIIQSYRKDIEMVDSMGTLFYACWIVFFVLVLAGLFTFRNNEKRLNVVHVIAAVPALVTGIYLTITTITFLYALGQ